MHPQPEFRCRSIVEMFSITPDPRIDRKKKYTLTEIFVSAIAAVMCGAESYYEIEETAEDLEAWMKENRGLEFPYGTPSHDTYRRVFSIISPAFHQKRFKKYFLSGFKQSISSPRVTSLRLTVNACEGS
jgi:hypothetical protein